MFSARRGVGGEDVTDSRTSGIFLSFVTDKIDVLPRLKYNFLESSEIIPSFPYCRFKNCLLILLYVGRKSLVEQAGAA